MSHALRIIVVTALGFGQCIAAEPARIHFLTFPKGEIEALGQVDKLNVTVPDCSWIAALKGVPELYNIKMGVRHANAELARGTATPWGGSCHTVTVEWRYWGANSAGRRREVMLRRYCHRRGPRRGGANLEGQTARTPRITPNNSLERTREG